MSKRSTAIKVRDTAASPKSAREIVATAKSIAQGQRAGQAPRIDGEVRQTMIAQAAYFRAEKRGFAGDAALDDWLEAERQIDQALCG